MLMLMLTLRKNRLLEKTCYQAFTNKVQRINKQFRRVLLLQRKGVHDKSILIAVEDPNAQGAIVPVAYNSDNIPNEELLSQIKKLQSMLLKGDLPI